MIFALKAIILLIINQFLKLLWFFESYDIWPSWFMVKFENYENYFYFYGITVIYFNNW